MPGAGNSFNTPFSQFAEEKARHGQAKSNLVQTGLPVIMEVAQGRRWSGSRPGLSNHPMRSQSGSESGKVSGGWSGRGHGRLRLCL